MCAREACTSFACFGVAVFFCLPAALQLRLSGCQNTWRDVATRATQHKLCEHRDGIQRNCFGSRARRGGTGSPALGVAGAVRSGCVSAWSWVRGDEAAPRRGRARRTTRPPRGAGTALRGCFFNLSSSKHRSDGWLESACAPSLCVGLCLPGIWTSPSSSSSSLAFISPEYEVEEAAVEALSWLS